MELRGLGRSTSSELSGTARPRPPTDCALGLLEATVRGIAPSFG
jgi:hypothetical protein